MKIENLNLSALKYFIDSVELESMTLSAQKNHVSRPAVSQAISRLEDWYGKRLLVHEKRSFELTSDGKKFYRFSKKSFETLKLHFHEESEPDNSLRIGCSASLMDLVFPKIQPWLSKSHLPTIKVGPSYQLIDLLLKNQIRAAFLIDSKKDPRFDCIEFQSGKFELRSKSGKVNEILITTERKPEVESFLRFASAKKIRIEKHVEVESWTLAIRLAELMNGTCLVPDYIASAKLRKIDLKAWKFPYSAQLISQKEATLSSLESQLVQSIHEL